MAVIKNVDLMESYFFYWKATSEREKVGEPYIYTLADHPLMQPLYDESFSKESVRRALSAISNREIFSPNSQKEGRFWNNNMWMLEDLTVAEAMMAPIKVLSVEGISEIDGEVAFVPGHLETIYLDEKNKRVCINFFKIMMDHESGKMQIEGNPIETCVKQALLKLK